MPTILSLCGLPIPGAVQGRDFSRTVTDAEAGPIDSALLALYRPFHEWTYNNGGREYRGLYDGRYTYVRTLDGPWLLYDNDLDPMQENNLVEKPEHASSVKEFDARLAGRLEAVGDDFPSGREIVEREGYVLNKRGDIMITPSELPEPYPES